MIPERPTCSACPHLPHVGQPCRTHTVTGPPCTKGKAVGDGYDHGNRTITQCCCPALTLIEGTEP